MDNPYDSVVWPTVLQVPSTPHLHLHAPWEEPPLSPQRRLDNAYRGGLRHVPVSNYYPSAPCSAVTRQSDFLLRQAWDARCRGVVVPAPVDWNDRITWAAELPPAVRHQLPFGESGLVLPQVPADLILSPNAEHHSFTNSDCHVTCPGSDLCSGNFDARGRFGLEAHGYPPGYGGTWQGGFAELIKHLSTGDGGGIIIAHPTWSRLTDAAVIEMLAFDPRVLGIEVYNDGVAAGIRAGHYPAEAGEPDPGFSTHLWDRVLATGQRCLGFCVPDHSVAEDGDWLGRIVLLVPAFTEACCLRAYRQGCFYACLTGEGVRVVSFSVDEQRASIRLSVHARVRFIADGYEVAAVSGAQANWSVPGGGDMSELTYLRVEVEDDTGERLLLQPVMFGGGGNLPER